MTRRYRSISGPPLRSATETWQVVTELVVGTLDRSPVIDGPAVATELLKVKGIACALIAGGHFAAPLKLVSEDLDAEIAIVSDGQAWAVDENLNPIPGGASATADWKLHFPTGTPLEAALNIQLTGLAHLTLSEQASVKASVKASAAALDLTSLANLRREK